MKKFRKLAAGIAFAGSAFCVTSAISVLPVAESVVFADNQAVTVEEGDAFEVSTLLTTEGYSYYLADGPDSADMLVLSETAEPGTEDGTYDLNIMFVINTVGSHEIIIEDGNGEIVKTVSVNVTAFEDEAASGDGEDGNPEDSEGEQDNNTDPDEGDNNKDDETETVDDTGDNHEDGYEPEYLVFLSVSGAKISGSTESGEFKPGEKIKLSIEKEKGYVLRRWVIRNLDGVDVTESLDITEDGTFTLPDYPIRVSAELNYNLVHEIELLDVTEKLEPGKPITFTGHVKDNTDPRFFLLAEIWINEYDTKGITNSAAINNTIEKNGVTLLDKVDAGDKYNYSVMFMTTEGYEFADDVKLIYNGMEYSPTDEVTTDGNETAIFSGFLSFGTQTNPKETKTRTKTVTREETKTETVTQYVYNTYTYTTYQYVTRYVTVPASGGGVARSTKAPLTGDSNNAGIWIALAIAAGGGVVSGILVGRKRRKK